tara:strand:- start:158 stop:475 length:318 start_codon:yes stop_codon:yes gene_type:complete
MINTDKYEGHLMDKAVEDNSQVWCWSKWLLKNAENIEQMNATAELLKDAPKLLAEVKRLQKKVKKLNRVLTDLDEKIHNYESHVELMKAFEQGLELPETWKEMVE